MSDELAVVYGPVLPLHKKNSSDDESDDDLSACGPSLPAKNSREKSPSTEEASYGPSLPPHLSKIIDHKSENKNSHGPTLPAQLTESRSERSKQNTILGPALPPGFQREPAEDSDSSCDDNFAGPLPPDRVSAASLALEERALEIKLSKFSQGNSADRKDEREEWMMIPPEIMSRAGVPKTQFSKSKCEIDRDQSAWTETPEDKRRKAQGLETKVDKKRKAQDTAESLAAKKRDREQEEIARKHKKKHKRDKSLLDMHSEKRKKEKESKSDNQARRPFSRETDLQLSKFDSRQVKSVIDKAKILDSRFSSGSNKYL